MANPNNIYKNSSRKNILCVEDVRNTLADAEKLRDELKEKYPIVRITKFRVGSRKLFLYSYAIRAYKKPTT